MAKTWRKYISVDANNQAQEHDGAKYGHARKNQWNNLYTTEKIIRHDGRSKPRFSRTANVNDAPKPDVDTLLKVHIGDIPEEFKFIFFKLTKDEHEQISKLLKRNREGFAWNVSQMPKISSVCHKLDIQDDAKLIRQKTRRMVANRMEKVIVDIQSLLDINFI